MIQYTKSYVIFCKIELKLFRFWKPIKEHQDPWTTYGYIAIFFLTEDSQWLNVNAT